jgi:hypothetical protein
MPQLQPPFPAMYIKPAVTKGRRDHWNKIKSKVIPNNEFFITVALDQFVKLAKTSASGGLKAFFACYAKTGDASDQFIPSGNDGHLTLIFAPTDSNKIVIPNNYYTITKGNVSKIADVAASKWINAYQTTLYPQLLKTPEMSGRTETKAIWYSSKQILEFADTLEKGQLNGKVGKILIRFSAHLPEETVDFGTGGIKSVGNQLSLVFSAITKGSAAVNPINRSVGAMLYMPDGGDGGGGDDDDDDNNGFDSGMPCPPDTNC